MVVYIQSTIVRNGTQTLVDPNIIAGTCPNWTSMFTTDNQIYQTFQQLRSSLPGCFSYCCCRNGSNRPQYDSPSVAVVLNLIQSIAFLEDTPLSTEHDHLKQQVWLTFWVKDAAKSLRTFRLLSQHHQQKSRSLRSTIHLALTASPSCKPGHIQRNSCNGNYLVSSPTFYH